MENEKPEESQVKVERFTRNLRVTLREPEVVERAKRSAYLLGEIQQKQDERDAAKKQANAQIEELEAEMHRLSLEVRDGGTYKDVPCERRYIYRTGTVQEVRTDTGDLLNERAMTDRERQLELGVSKPAAPAEAKKDDGVVDDDYKPDGATELPTAKGKRGRKGKNEAGAEA